MSLRKRLAGIKEFDFDVLLRLAVLIDHSERNAPSPSSKFDEIWETWEWLAFFRVNHGGLSKEDFARLYSLLKRQPVDFSFDYQKANEQDGQRLALLFAEIQTLLRPHLSVAFLPNSYDSEVWPLIGRPLKRVKVASGYGEILPEQIVRAVEKLSFRADDESNIPDFAYMTSSCFVGILKFSNELDRQNRLGIRLSAFEILPLFITFELGKVRI